MYFVDDARFALCRQAKTGAALRWNFRLIPRLPSLNPVLAPGPGRRGTKGKEPHEAGIWHRCSANPWRRLRSIEAGAFGLSARHAADLGIIPVVLEDACGAGHADAAQRSCQALRFAGDAIMTDTEAFCAALGKTGRS
jgi:hypothetical protein